MARQLKTAVAMAIATVSFSALGAATASASTTASPQPVGGSIGAIVCSSPGNCAAAGDFELKDGSQLPLVASQKNGTWGKAATIGGLSALPGGEQGVGLGPISCASAGNCGAGGGYEQQGDPEDAASQGMLVTEKNGVWGKALAVPGLAALNVGGRARVDLISCRSAGDCTAAGVFAPVKEGEDDNITKVFVVSEKNGTWGKAEQIPGLAAVDNGLSGERALFCVSAGNCTLAGGNSGGPFVASQKNGAWGTVTTFPSIAAAKPTFASLDTLNCPSAGNCVGTGAYYTSDNVVHVYAVNEANGTWGPVKPIPGFANLPGGGTDIVTDTNLTCPATGDCSLGGTYTSESDGVQSFVVAERNGTWGTAQTLPGVLALTTSGVSLLHGLACPSTTSCVAAGGYAAKVKGHIVGINYVMTEKNGKWGKPETLPGEAALSADVIPQTLACGGVGSCTLGGLYSNQHDEPFISVEKNGVWAKAETLPGVKAS